MGRESGHSRLPARLISAIVLVLVVWLVYWFSSNDMFYIQSVQIEGGGRLPETELTAISGLAGVNVFWADTQGIEQRIEDLPDIAAARVRCGLPARCVIHLVEREPLFVWLQGEAKAWIGDDGTVLPARGDFVDAIALNAGGSTALKPGDEVDSELVKAVSELQRLKPEIRQYEYSEQFGLSFQDEHGWLVRLGAGPDVEARLKVLEALTNHLTSQGIVPSFVDVRYPEAPYYREQT